MCAQSWRRVRTLGFVTSLSGIVISGAAACSGGHDPSPGTVAITYLEAVYGDDVQMAVKYVAPEDAYIPQFIDALIGPQSVKVYRLAVQSEAVHGDKATVQLVGEICSSGNRRPLASIPFADRHCVSSTGTGANGATFTVQLAEVKHHWLVEFPNAKLPGG